jgi:hypothetical protein
MDRSESHFFTGKGQWTALSQTERTGAVNRGKFAAPNT